MNIYRIGEPYIAGKKQWAESAEYNFRQNTHELRLFMRDITAKERSDIRRGPSEFAVALHEPVIFFLYRFGESIPWSDAPYSIHMVPPEQRTLPDILSSGAGALLQIILVSADAGLVEALRVVSLSPHLSRVLHEAIRIQAAAPFDQRAYDEALRALYLCYPASTNLLSTSVARSHGGD